MAKAVSPLFYSFEDKEAVDAFYGALCKTEVLLVPLEDFRHKLRTSADYAYHTLRWYAEEMDHIVLRLKSLEKSTAKQKILRALHYLGDQHPTKETRAKAWRRISFPLTQQILADLTGLTRETVNAVLNESEFSAYYRSTKRQRFEVQLSKVATALEEL